MKADLYLWFLAILPIVVLLILMVNFKMPAGKAAPIGLAIAVLVGAVFYGAGTEVILWEAGKGLWNSFIVILIIWPAILIYEVTNEAGGFTVIRSGLKKFSPNELIQIIAIGWVFVGFLQGITGFGVPVAVGAPLLLGLGVRPLWAVVIPLLGQAWGNTFGTLAVGWNALVMQADLQASTLILNTAFWAALLILIMNYFMGVAICWFYGKKQGIIKGLPVVFVIGTIQGVGQLLLTQMNTTLCCFLIACVAFPALFFVSRLKMYREMWMVEDSSIMDREKHRELIKDETNVEKKNISIHLALIPYYVLSIATILVLLVTPINEVLSSRKLGFSFPETRTDLGIINEAVYMYSPLTPFTNSGLFLIVAALAGFICFRARGMIGKGKLWQVIRKTTRSTVPSATAVIAFVVMASIMGGTGQTALLALGVSAVAGKYYAIFAPLVGTLGSFMTSSNMSSNILFADFQRSVAEVTGLDQAVILGGQTAGGALGTIIAPGKIILGTTTSGIVGREGEIIRIMVPLIIINIVIFGILMMIFGI